MRLLSRDLAGLKRNNGCKDATGSNRILLVPVRGQRFDNRSDCSVVPRKPLRVSLQPDPLAFMDRGVLGGTDLSNRPHLYFESCIQALTAAGSELFAGRTMVPGVSTPQV